MKPVTQAAIDPRWELLTVVMDGNQLAVLRIEHPEHGTLDSIMPRDSLEKLRDTLVAMLRVQ